MVEEVTLAKIAKIAKDAEKRHKVRCGAY